MRVILPNGTSFLATLCPEAIPYDQVLKGVSHKKYLEIDSAFAAELGIRVFEQGITVSVIMCGHTPSLGKGVANCIHKDTWIALHGSRLSMQSNLGDIMDH